MSRRSPRRDALARAEARRRARYVAQGRSPDDIGEDEGNEAADEPRAAAAPARGSLLQRLFPAPPPLPDKPDPLAGFTYEGRLRGLAEAFYLLRRHPLPWLVGGLVWALGRTLSDNSMTGVLASLVSFTALIGAGWVGWWRPWLAGLAAGIVGWLVFLGMLGALTVAGPPQAAASPTPSATGTPVASASAAASSPSTPPSPVSSGSPAPNPSTTPPPTASDIAVALAAQTAIQIALGAGAGWYGGYLRRRMVANTPARRTRPRR